MFTLLSERRVGPVLVLTCLACLLIATPALGAGTTYTIGPVSDVSVAAPAMTAARRDGTSLDGCTRSDRRCAR